MNVIVLMVWLTVLRHCCLSILLVAQDVDFSSVDELMGHSFTVALFCVGECDHVSCVADSSSPFLLVHLACHSKMWTSVLLVG